MKLRIFSIPAHGDAAAEQELNAFLSSHRIQDVDRRFVDDGASSFWSIAVVAVPTDEARLSGQVHAGRKRVDYREILSEEDFAVYSRLREVRKLLAERDGVAPYLILTNEQLAKVVTDRVLSRADFERIRGVGPARSEKYAEEFLRVLRPASEGGVSE